MKSTSHAPAPSNLSNPRGRPREFDMDEALDKVIPLFSAHGYNGASINDIASTMQLTVGSIYKAFKDKRNVYLAAIDRQSSLRHAALRKAIDAAKSGRNKVRAALLFYVGLSNSDEGAQGCMVVGTTVGLASFDDEIGDRARHSFKRREALLLELIELGQADGSITASGGNAGNAATAGLLLCLIQGIIVIGKAGKTRKELMAIVDAALKVLD